MLLYKYYNENVLSEEILKNLLSGNVRFKHPIDFNDPLDSMFHYSTELDANALDGFAKAFSKRLSSELMDASITKKVIIDSCENLRGTRQDPPYFSDMYHMMREEFQGDFRNIMSELKEDTELRSYISTFDVFYEFLTIFCMTKKNNSIPMWSYYSSDHRGICVEYELDHALIDGDRLRFGSVVYDAPAFVENTTGATDKDELARFVLTKSSDWSHEDEVRLYGFAHPEFVKFPGKVKRVCMGLKIEQSKRELLVDVIENFEVGVAQAALHYKFQNIYWND